MNMSVENKSCSRHIKRHLAYLLEFLLARLKGLGIQIATNTTLADHWHTFKSLNWINVFTIPVSIYLSILKFITWLSKVEICLTKSGVAPVVHTRNYQSLIPESCILSHHSLTVSHRRPGCCEARCLQNTTESWAGMGVKLCTLYSDQDWLSLPPARAAWSLTHVRGQWQPIRRPNGESATNQRLGTPHSLHTRDPNTASNTNTRIIPV